MTDPLIRQDRPRVLIAVLAALVVWMFWNGVSKGMAAVSTGEIAVGGERG